MMPVQIILRFRSLLSDMHLQDHSVLIPVFRTGSAGVTSSVSADPVL